MTKAFGAAVAGIILLVLIAAACPRHCVYVDRPIGGRVVDLETGERIWGAAVVEVWRRDFIRMDGGAVFHAAQETRTDLQGRFALPRRSGISLHPFSWILAPTLLVFRPGYAPCGDSLSGRQECPLPVIRLRQLKADERQHAGTPSTVCPPRYSACPRGDVPGWVVPDTSRLVAAERSLFGQVMDTPPSLEEVQRLWRIVMGRGPSDPVPDPPPGSETLRPGSLGFPGGTPRPEGIHYLGVLPFSAAEGRIAGRIMLPSGELVSVHEGDTIPSGWTIRKLSPEGALLRYALPRDQAVLLRLEGKQLVDAVEVAIPATPRAFAAPREQGAGPATLPLGIAH